MIKVKLLKNIFFQMCLFLLIITEFMTIVGVPITLIWKGVLVIYLLFKLLERNSTFESAISFLGLIFALKMLIYDYSNVVSFSSEIIYSIKIVSFILIVEELVYVNKHFPQSIVVFSMKLAIGLILVTLPFLLGVIEPTVDTSRNSLAKFGYADIYEFVGPFGGKHNAAVNLAGALLVLIANFRLFQGNIKKICFILLITIGVYALYKTYVRTGYSVFLIGLIVLYFTSGNIKEKIKRVPLLLIFFFGIYVVYINSDIFRMRILDQNIYNNASAIGSGRLVFYAVGIESFINGSILQIFLGVGDGHAKEIMESYLGNGYASHSGFLDILRISGLVGFIIYLFFLFNIMKLIKSIESNSHSPLLYSLFAGYLVIMLFQGGYYFWYNTLFACYLAYAIVVSKYGDNV